MFLFFTEAAKQKEWCQSNYITTNEVNVKDMDCSKNHEVYKTKQSMNHWLQACISPVRDRINLKLRQIPRNADPIQWEYPHV